MSSIDALSNATSALANIKQQLGVVAENVGNSQNQNFTQRNATTSNPTQTEGFSTVTISRAVDQVLQNEVLSQTSTAGNTAYTQQFYQQLDSLTGSNTTNPALSSASSQLLTAFQGLQAQPDSQTAQNQVLTAAQNLVQQVQNLSSGIQTIRSQTQSDLSGNVTTLNADLAQIQTLNQQIVSNSVAGKPVTDLQDQRDQTIASVANLVPVRQQQNSDGSIYLYTPDGVSLVDQTASNFSYDPSQNPPGQTPVTGQPANGILYLTNDSSKTAVNGSFSGGAIGAQFNILRGDSTAIQSTQPSLGPLAKLQQQLNNFADLFYNGTTPTAFQSAYNGATSSSTTNLSSNLFVINTATPTSLNDANNLVVNPALTSVVSPATSIQTIKPLSGTAVTAALQQNVSFGGGTTNIASTSGTINQIANIIASDQSSRSSQAATDATTASANLSSTTTSYRGQVGVNLDQQLSLLVVLQNSYNAAAKIIGAVDKLQQTLFSAV